MASYEELLKDAVERFTSAGIEEAGIDAWLLLSHIFGIDRSFFFCEKKAQADEEKSRLFEALVEKREQRIPLQQLTGVQDFCGFDMKVTPDVLVPRQDTEVLVELVTDHIKKIIKNRGCGYVPSVLDMCTGSGCIAIAIAKLSRAVVTASDLSEAALAVARENAQNNSAQVHFRKGDLFEAIEQSETFDLIVSNPPYITEDEFEDLSPEVKDYEPRMALVAQEQGLQFYRRMAEEAAHFLKEDGSIWFEIGCSQAAAVSVLLEQNGWTDIKVYKDLAGLDRVVSASAPRKGCINV